MATLNGEPVRRALLEQLVVNKLGTPNPYDLQSASAAASAPSVDRQRMLDELLGIELLAQKARERGLDKSPSVRAESELQSKTLLAQAVVREQIAGIKVSEAELQALYEDKIPPHEFQLFHTMLPDRAAAEAFIEQLRQGRRFKELTGKRGRGPGWAMAEQMPPEVASVIKRLKPGEYSPQPLLMDQEWHVVQLVATRPVKRPSLQTAQVWLHPQLVQLKVQAQQQQWREQATVQVSPTP